MNQRTGPIAGVQLTLLGTFIGLSFVESDVFWVGVLLVLVGTIVVATQLTSGEVE